MTNGCINALRIGILLMLASAAWAQEEEEKTPSVRTKEAIGKLSKTPDVVRKSLKEAADKVRSLVQEKVGTKTPSKADPDPWSIPTKKTEPERPQYSPSGQRDPFRPFSIKIKPSEDNRSPLTKYKLVGVVSDGKSRRALIEDSTGSESILAVESLIGPNKAKVIAIYDQPTKVLIKESYVDGKGKKNTREVVCSLDAPRCEEKK